MIPTPAAAAPAQSAGDSTTQEAAPAGPVTTVCIEAYPDGTYKVGIESPQDEAAEAAGDEAQGDAGYQPAPDIDSALKMAKDLLMKGTGGDEGVQAAFESGFGVTGNSPFQKAGV